MLQRVGDVAASIQRDAFGSGTHRYMAHCDGGVADPRSVVEQEGLSRASPGGDATALRGDDRRDRCVPVKRAS